MSTPTSPADRSSVLQLLKRRGDVAQIAVELDRLADEFIRSGEQLLVTVNGILKRRGDWPVALRELGPDISREAIQGSYATELDPNPSLTVLACAALGGLLDAAARGHTETFAALLENLRLHREVYDAASEWLQGYLRNILGRHYRSAVRGFVQRANELLSPLGWEIDSLTTYNFKRQGAELTSRATLVVNYWHDPFTDMNWPDANGLLTAFGACPYATNSTPGTVSTPVEPSAESVGACPQGVASPLDELLGHIRSTEQKRLIQALWLPRRLAKDALYTEVYGTPLKKGQRVKGLGKLKSLVNRTKANLQIASPKIGRLYTITEKDRDFYLLNDVGVPDSRAA